jgi:translocation and assembly module TamB
MTAVSQDPSSPPHAPARRRRWWLGAGLVLLGAVLVPAAVLLWLLQTDAGGRRLLQWLPGVQVEAASGSIFDSHFSARRLVIAASSPAPGQPALLEVDDLAWHGARWRWLPGNGAWLDLEIAELRVRRVALHTGPPSQERLVAPRSLRLPLNLHVRTLLVEELHVDRQEPLRGLLGSLQLGASGGAEHRAELRSLSWQHVDGSAQARIGADTPFALEASLQARADRGETWQAEARAQGPLSSFDIKARLAGQARDKGSAPALDAQAQIRPFEAWPLGNVSASTRALDLASLLPQAPRTRIDGRALIRSQGLKQPVDVEIELDNAAATRLGEGGWPVHALRLVLKADPRQPQRLLLGPFEIEAADQRGPAGRFSGSGVWEGSSLRLQSRLSDIQPQRLAAQAAAMRLSGPLEFRIDGLPTPDPRQPGPDWRGLSGLVAQVRGELEGHVSGAPQAVRLVLDAQAQSGSLEVRTLQASSGDARAELSAQLKQIEPGRWRLASEGTLKAFDPVTWIPGSDAAAWGRGPHRLNGSWTLELSAPERLMGTPLAQWLPRLQGRADVKLADSRLAGVPLQGELALSQDSREPHTQRSRARGELRLGSGSLQFDGSGDPSGSGSSDRTQLRLQLPALAELAPLAALLPAASSWTPRRGQLQLQASLRGRWPEMGAEIDAVASELQVGELSLARASVRGHVDRQRADELSLKFEGTRLAWGSSQVDQLRGDVQGSLARHRFEVEVDAPLQPPTTLAQWLDWRTTGKGARSRADGTGGWTSLPAGGGRWSVQLERLSLSAREAESSTGSRGQPVWLEAGALQGEAVFDAQGSPQQLTLNPGRVRSGALALRWSEANWQAQPQGPGSWRLLAELEPWTVAPVLQRLPQARGGALSWSGDLQMGALMDIRAGARFEAELRLQRLGGDLSFSDGGAPAPLGLSTVELRLQARDGQWRLQPRIQGQMLGNLQGEALVRTAAADRWPAPNAPIEGQLAAQVASLAAWAGWLPPGWRLQGEADAQARLSGTWGAPGYTGFVQARRVAVRNLLQGVDLQDGELRLQLEGDRARVETLTLRGGEGRLSAEGSARFGAQPQLQLSARADKLRVLGRVDRQLVISGQAQLSAASDRFKLDGRIVADSGLIDLSRRDGPTLDDDVTVLRGGAQPEAELARREPSPLMRQMQVLLEIDLGRQLRLRGRGLDTGLSGKLTLTAPRGRLAINGTVRADSGTYAAYGQKLEIERGLVVLTGPLDSARLDILALRPNLDQRVGVAITGAALEPRVRLYSEPEMAETDKLSWLVLGRGPEGLGRTDTALLQRAALALLAGEEGAPTDGVLRALGLDEFSIRQSEGEVRDTVVSVGKQLSRRWYVGYERGVNATAGTWQLVYRAAQRFTLRAQSGQENSLDLIWTWRFGAPAPP